MLELDYFNCVDKLHPYIFVAPDSNIRHTIYDILVLYHLQCLTEEDNLFLYFIPCVQLRHSVGLLHALQIQG